MTRGARQATHRLVWSLIVLFAFTIIIGLLNLLFTSNQVHNLRHTNARLEQQVRADCGWYEHISGLPITFPPGAVRPTRLGVQLIVDSRIAWTGHGCPGKIPPPDPSLLKWAAYYHISTRS